MDSRVTDLVESIYGSQPAELLSGLQRLLEEPQSTSEFADLWDETDVVLITYADQIRQHGRSPLQAQNKFLLDHSLDDLFSCVHLLPFCPYTSDDGFSVVDYLAVDQASGSWSDINNLGHSFDLMFDLVLNHASQQNSWFQSYLAGNPEYDNYFIEVDASADLSAVVRPRSLPLLTTFESAAGEKQIWTTFSAIKLI